MALFKLSYALSSSAFAASLLVAPSLHARHGDRAPAPMPRGAPSQDLHGLEPYRARLVASALEHLESQRHTRRHDCSGLVESVLEATGVFERGGTRAFFARAQTDRRLKRGGPLPGDFAFFDRTFDKDRDGRVDDPLTHMAIVVDVHADGTIDMVHRTSSSGTRLLRMNLRYPHRHRVRGVVMNDFLSAPGYGPRKLASELFRSFASPPRPRAFAPTFIDAARVPHGGHDGYRGPSLPSPPAPHHEHARGPKPNKQHNKQHKGEHRHDEVGACGDDQDDDSDSDLGRGRHRGQRASL